MKSILNTNNHSVYFLKYNLIIVTKHRTQIIDSAIAERLKSIFENIAHKEQYCLEIVSFDYSSDHLCIYFNGEPKSELSKFINAYKSASSRLIKKEFSESLKELDGGVFWSKSFLLLTQGNISDEIKNEYIKSQASNNK